MPAKSTEYERAQRAKRRAADAKEQTRASFFRALGKEDTVAMRQLLATGHIDLGRATNEAGQTALAAAKSLGKRRSIFFINRCRSGQYAYQFHLHHTVGSAQSRAAATRGSTAGSGPPNSYGRLDELSSSHPLDAAAAEEERWGLLDEAALDYGVSDRRSGVRGLWARVPKSAPVEEGERKWQKDMSQLGRLARRLRAQRDAKCHNPTLMMAGRVVVGLLLLLAIIGHFYVQGGALDPVVKALTHPRLHPGLNNRTAASVRRRPVSSPIWEVMEPEDASPAGLQSLYGPDVHCIRAPSYVGVLQCQRIPAAASATQFTAAAGDPQPTAATLGPPPPVPFRPAGAPVNETAGSAASAGELVVVLLGEALQPDSSATAALAARVGRAVTYLQTRLSPGRHIGGRWAGSVQLLLVEVAGIVEAEGTPGGVRQVDRMSALATGAGMPPAGLRRLPAAVVPSSGDRAVWPVGEATCRAVGWLREQRALAGGGFAEVVLAGSAAEMGWQSRVWRRVLLGDIRHGGVKLVDGVINPAELPLQRPSPHTVTGGNRTGRAARCAGEFEGGCVRWLVVPDAWADEHTEAVGLRREARLSFALDEGLLDSLRC